MPGHDVLTGKHNLLKTFGKMETAQYQILNLNVSIHSDSRELLDRFDQDYGWFRAPNGTGGSSLAFYAQFHGDDPGLACTRTPLANDSEDSLTHSHETAPSDAAILHASFFTLHSFLGHPSPVSYAFQQIVRTLFSELTDYMVLHAGVLEREGQALILSGPPGAGKSTLTMALLERDCGFLSDDFCPLERGTGLVYPFPRSVWMVAEGRYGASSCSRRGKQSIAVNQLPGSVYLSPCIPKWVICLDPGQWSKEVKLVAYLREEGAEAFIRDTVQIEGVNVARSRPDIQEWQIHYPLGQGLSGPVQDILDRYRHVVRNLYRPDRACPDFEKTPVLTRISTFEATFRLFGELKQEPYDLTRDSIDKKKIGPLFMELTGLLEDVACYRMTPGGLDEMIKLILHLINRKS
jgi:hypothetical protein